MSGNCCNGDAAAASSLRKAGRCIKMIEIIEMRKLCRRKDLCQCPDEMGKLLNHCRSNGYSRKLRNILLTSNKSHQRQLQSLLKKSTDTIKLPFLKDEANLGYICRALKQIDSRTTFVRRTFLNARKNGPSSSLNAAFKVGFRSAFNVRSLHSSKFDSKKQQQPDEYKMFKGRRKTKTGINFGYRSVGSYHKIDRSAEKPNIADLPKLLRQLNVNGKPAINGHYAPTSAIVAFTERSNKVSRNDNDDMINSLKPSDKFVSATDHANTTKYGIMPLTTFGKFSKIKDPNEYNAELERKKILAIISSKHPTHSSYRNINADDRKYLPNSYTPNQYKEPPMPSMYTSLPLNSKLKGMNSRAKRSLREKAKFSNGPLFAYSPFDPNKAYTWKTLPLTKKKVQLRDNILYGDELATAKANDITNHITSLLLKGNPNAERNSIRRNIRWP